MPTEGERRRLLSPEIIHQISNVNLAARLVAEGFITGRHKSLFHGSSLEFAEHREYVFGDELKHIDWKVYSKTDKYYVKLYEAETCVKVYLLNDISNSMGYMSTKNKVSKIQYAKYLSAALSYIIIKQQDQVGLVTFDEEIKDFVPPRSSVGHLRVITEILQNTNASSKTKIPQSLHNVAERLKRRGLIVIFSDLLDDMQEVSHALRHFKNKQHDVIVFHILDDDEYDFGFDKLAYFEDMETKERILVDPKALKEEYLKEFGGFLNDYQSLCTEIGVDYVPIKTSVPFDYSLMAYLERRKMMG